MRRDALGCYSLAEDGGAGGGDGGEDVAVGGVRDDGAEVGHRGVAVATVDGELALIGEKKAMGGVLEDLLADATVVDGGREHRALGEIDAAGTDERLREQQWLEKADRGRARETVEEIGRASCRERV